MPRNGLPFYRFNAADYLNDPAVMGMDADTEGCYARLLARSWNTATPGVIDAGLVPEMCGLHRLAEQYRILFQENPLQVDAWDEAPESIARFRQTAVLTQLAAAFDTESQPGFWVQKRMVTEHRYATNVLRAQIQGGRKTPRGNTNGGSLEVPSRLPPANREVRRKIKKKTLGSDLGSTTGGAPAGEPKSAPVAIAPLTPNPHGKVHDGYVPEPPTTHPCRECGTNFLRPVRSTQDLCAKCWLASQETP